jgi:hypothetical protein
MDEYRIVMHCWNPEFTTIKKQRITDYVGGVARYVRLESEEQAKDSAREVWKENYEGAIKQIKIFKGPELVYDFDNFEKFMKQ